MARSVPPAVLVSVALATAIHLDWHVARPTTHHLSLGLPWHWLLAIPVFGLAAWYVARAWPTKVRSASPWIIGSAVVLAGFVEPAWEYFLEDAPFDWAFGSIRNVALGTFMLTGVITYVAVLTFLTRERVTGSA